MSVELHRQAEAQFAEAERLELVGDERALRMFADAARLEEEAIGHIPGDRVRTRSILAESAVSLWRRAHDATQAARAARRLLALDLDDYTLAFLLEVATEDLWSRSLRVADLAHGGTYEVALRGGMVRNTGLAPIDLVRRSSSSFCNLVLRIGEWTIGVPFRVKGPPAEEITDSIIPMVSPATVGSYAFELRLEARAVQLELFSRQPVNAQVISAGFLSILDQVAREGPEGVKEQVPDEQYRTAFLRLVRNIAPTGARPLGNRRQAKGRDVEVRLAPDSRRRIDRALQPRKGDTGGSATHTIHRGTLRGLDLDRRHLVLREDDRKRRYKSTQGLPWMTSSGPS